MPLLRNAKGSKVVAAFEKAGGVKRKGKGSHINIKMPNGQSITIPKGIVKIGLLKAAIKRAGLNEKEFIKLLGGKF